MKKVYRLRYSTGNYKTIGLDCTDNLLFNFWAIQYVPLNKFNQLKNVRFFCYDFRQKETMEIVQELVNETN